ncbi:MAG: hypothetical protein QOI24_3814 [Acidobacteriota bacterium]|nr:hypothetical protein [Acidobacteriota bacterium]
MLSLETELVELRQRGAIDERTCSRLVALERGEIFPIGLELRAAAYVAVAMILGGLGTVIAKNLDRIGPLAISIALGLAAAICYIPAIRALRRNEQRTAVGEYVLLLGALLLAAGIGFIEKMFHPLGGLWTLHLLFIAFVHAAGAYVFNSKLLLSASLASLASWFGFQAGLDPIFFGTSAVSVGTAGLAAAVAIGIWRAINSRLARYRAFAGTFDFFIANVALISTIILASTSETRMLGLLLAVVFAAGAIVYGVVTREISFVVYGVIYAVIAVGFAAVQMDGCVPFFLAILVASIAGALTLWFVRQWMRRAA